MGYGGVVQVFGNEQLFLSSAYQYLTTRWDGFIQKFAEFEVKIRTVLDTTGGEDGQQRLAGPGGIPLSISRLNDLKGVLDGFEARLKSMATIVCQRSDTLGYDNMIKVFKPDTFVATVYCELHRKNCHAATLGKFEGSGSQ